MDVVDVWDGAKAMALRKALRMTQEDFAAKLGTVPRNVAKWNSNPQMEPDTAMQQALDTMLYRAEPPVQARFALILGKAAEAACVPADLLAGAERALLAEAGTEPAIDWLDRRSAAEPGASRTRVLEALATMDKADLRLRGGRRGTVTRADMSDRLVGYYGCESEVYRAKFGGPAPAHTSIVTRTDWLDLACPLSGEVDAISLTQDAREIDILMDARMSDAAIRRIAEGIAVGMKLVDAPLYRLIGIDVRPGRLAGGFALTTFAQYALTMDLLEAELVDGITSGDVGRDSLPLRSRYLPDISSVHDVGGRVCAGGALALVAIARPSVGDRSADYMLLVQERSGRVLNAARRLAVIPKCFHQPIVDYRGDTKIGASLRREMEEELFGRDDVDIVAGSLRAADPMHHARLSEPMKWLHEADQPGQWRMECTGFGLNLVSGNYEFASLIVIDDEEFWHRFGGQISANWESDSLRQYSTRDTEMMRHLMSDPTWSNEGLFALLQGTRRLTEIGGERVALPTVELEI